MSWIKAHILDEEKNSAYLDEGIFTLKEVHANAAADKLATEHAEIGRVPGHIGQQIAYRTNLARCTQSMMLLIWEARLDSWHAQEDALQLDKSNLTRTGCLET